MDFGGALSFLKEGFKLSRKEWIVQSNPTVKKFIKYEENTILLYRSGKGTTEYNPSHREMFANDWYLYDVKEEPKPKITTCAKCLRGFRLCDIC